MTVEVAVMNRMAVALAADSAATVTRGAAVKIHNSAVKLLTLSKRRPVGVMVYNKASLLDIPWETLIKMFRRELGDTGYDTLETYGQQLVSYLEDNPALFPAEAQKRDYLVTLEAEYSSIASTAEEELSERLQNDPYYSEEKFKNHQAECAENAIREKVQFWRGKDTVDCIDELLSKEFVGELSGEINDCVARSFRGWHLGNDSRRLLQELWEIAKLLIFKDHFIPEQFSGVVIAGFGEIEHFPVLKHFEIGGVYGNKLKVRFHPCEKISGNTPSIVKPFAYTETINTFLYGISSEDLKNLRRAIDLIGEMPVVAIDAIEGLSPDQRDRLERKIRVASLKQANEFSQSTFMGYSQRYQDIMQAIATLPPKELAHVASTLVSLSSFQQRMLLEPETVGGPVDIAVISKGDGFIWIDRKHYFRRELNQHFFDNYFEDASRQEKDDGGISNEQTASDDNEKD